MCALLQLRDIELFFRLFQKTNFFVYVLTQTSMKPNSKQTLINVLQCKHTNSTKHSTKKAQEKICRFYYRILYTSLTEIQYSGSYSAFFFSNISWLCTLVLSVYACIFHFTLLGFSLIIPFATAACRTISTRLCSSFSFHNPHSKLTGWYSFKSFIEKGCQATAKGKKKYNRKNFAFND